MANGIAVERRKKRGKKDKENGRRWGGGAPKLHTWVAEERAGGREERGRHSGRASNKDISVSKGPAPRTDHGAHSWGRILTHPMIGVNPREGTKGSDR